MNLCPHYQAVGCVTTRASDLKVAGSSPMGGMGQFLLLTVTPGSKQSRHKYAMKTTIPRKSPIQVITLSINKSFYIFCQCCGIFLGFQDPDPLVRGTIRIRHLKRKTLIPTVLWRLCDFLSLKDDVNVPSSVLWNRNYLLRFRFRFRFWLLKSYGSGSGSGSGSDFWKVMVPVPVPTFEKVTVPVPVPAPYLDHKKQI